MKLFSLCTLLLALSAPAETVSTSLTMSASSLKRSELPNEFPFQVLDVGFAVVRLEIENRSDSPTLVQPDTFQIFSAKGKLIERALPTDITPRLMKFYKGSRAGIAGDAGYGRYSRYPRYGRGPVISPGSSPRTVSINKAQEIRELLESFELQERLLQPGENLEGFYYLKSKESGNRLSDSYLQADGRRIDFQ